MLLYLLAFAGGVLTIVSPCILPVLPFVFSRADQPFPPQRPAPARRHGRHLRRRSRGCDVRRCLGRSRQSGWQDPRHRCRRAVWSRSAFFPASRSIWHGPLVRLGGRVQGRSNIEAPSVGRSLLLGVSTGLLWAPCAGPILGLILTGAALQGPTAHTTFLLLSFSAGSRNFAGCSAINRK
jgi:cytochrome c biogenesis protein CcdA